MSIKVGDINIAITLTLSENGLPFAIPLGATVQIRFMKPNRSILLKTAALVTNGADGLVRCIMDEGDLSAPGTWAADVTIVSGSNKWTTDQISFDVGTTLEWAATH